MPLFLNLLQNQLCSEAINVGIFICELLFIQTLSPTFGLNLVQTFSTIPSYIIDSAIKSHLT